MVYVLNFANLRDTVTQMAGAARVQWREAPQTGLKKADQGLQP
jgi:hypothetical protein